MSASHEWHEWHLTPGGWVEGAEMLDSGHGRSPITHAAPVDRVMTRRYHERMSSGFSSIDRYYETPWRSSDKELLGPALDRHGPHPDNELAKYRSSDSN